ncbi:hypothetical protein JOH51_007234 [Rhizobium leguminosarum]|nr:hypothetical protein [Rhizobium leguminosarum]
MDHESNDITSNIDLRPIVGLLSSESEQVIEILTVDAIKKHRLLVDRAERLFQTAHKDDQGVNKEPNEAHIAYSRTMCIVWFGRILIFKWCWPREIWLSCRSFRKACYSA